jgi:hypothetical protein
VNFNIDLYANNGWPHRLEDYSNGAPQQSYMLSGGERQRVEIARSLVWMAPAKIRKAAEITICGDPFTSRLDGKRRQIGVGNQVAADDLTRLPLSALFEMRIWDLLTFNIARCMSAILPSAATG